MLNTLVLILGLTQGQLSDAENLPVLVQRIESTNQCAGDFQSFAQALVQSLPSYGNRAIQRNRRSFGSQPVPTIITAGQLELEPLPLPPRTIIPEMIPEDAYQMFVTTLERTYVAEAIVDVQMSHWLFFTKTENQTENQWDLLIMFSHPQSPDRNDSVILPTNTSDGAIAQGIRKWLRDCQWQPDSNDRLQGRI